MKGKSMAVPKEVFRALVCFALMQLCGCGSIGWIPTLSIAVAGIDRREHQPDQTERKRLILKAEARLKWRLRPTANRSISQPTDDRRTAVSEIDYRTGRTSALREWENRERNRVIDETSRGWRQ